MPGSGKPLCKHRTRECRRRTPTLVRDPGHRTRSINRNHEEKTMSIRSRTIPTLLTLLAGLPAASANFTRIVPSTDTIIFNQTTAYATSPHTPLVFFLIMLSLGLVLLA